MLVHPLLIVSFSIYILGSPTHPTDIDNWPTDWTPIPIHTVPQDEDRVWVTFSEIWRHLPFRFVSAQSRIRKCPAPLLRSISRIEFMPETLLIGLHLNGWAEFEKYVFFQKHSKEWIEEKTLLLSYDIFFISETDRRHNAARRRHSWEWIRDYRPYLSGY